MIAQMDFFGRGSVQGPLAAYIAQQGRINPAFMRPILGEDGHTYFTVYKGGDPKKRESYHTYRHDEIRHLGISVYGTLRRDEWKQLDEAVQQAAHIRLGGIQSLIDRGLIYNLTNAMGTTVLEYHSINEAMEAEVSMDPAVRSRKDRPNYNTHYLPIPVIHSDFQISSRALEASRKLGNPLDVDSIQEATRVVNEKLELMLFNTSQTPFAFGGGYIYSYLDHPSRNTGSLTGAWTGLTGAQIVTDVRNMKQASINDRHYGPWELYIPTAYETVMDMDYDASTPGTTVRERITFNPATKKGISGIEDVKTIDSLPAGNVLLVEMNQRTVRLIRGMGIQVVQWQVGSSLSPTEYKVLTIQVPQVRADQSGKCGIIHYSV